MTTKTKSKTDLNGSKDVHATLRPERQRRILVAGSWNGSGKSTITATLLYPRIPACTIYSVDSGDSDASMYGVPVKRFSAYELEDLHQALLLNLDQAIVDVSTSSALPFLAYAVSANLLTKFDYFVIVVDPSFKGQAEALSTFQTLVHHGCHADRIRFILNRVAAERPVDLQFIHLFAYAHDNPRLSLLCQIPTFASFDECLNNYVRWQDAVSDNTDYDAAVREYVANGSGEKANTFARRAILVGQAKRTASWLDWAFQELNLEMGTV